MAVLKAKEARKMSPKERKKKLQELMTELARERASVASGTQPENPGKIRELRRAIARIKTVDHENANKKQEVEKQK